MSELLDFYTRQATSSRSAIPWLAELQADGLNAFTQYGFPTRHDEEWKYTLLDAWLTQRFVKAQAMPTKTTMPPVDNPFRQPQIVVKNGNVLIDEASRATLPAGVWLQSLEQALAQHPDKIKPYLGQLLKHEHGLQALNTAMLATGVVVYLPVGVMLEQPLVISYWQDEMNQAVFNRCLIIAEAGSQATIVEDYRGQDGCCYFTSTITEAWTATEAKLCHYKIQRESFKAFHIGHLSARLAKKSRFDSHSLSLGGQLVRSDTEVYLQESETSCLLNGIYAPVAGQHMDHHTAIYHQVPYCRSEQDYKGILSGRSRAVFNGKVIVAKDAQHTEARQQNKNLLLSTQAEIDSKPQLEIFADDVVCSHGATVGQLDEEALFYLATRGIARKEASQYLVQAFAANNLRLFPHPGFAEWVKSLLGSRVRNDEYSSRIN